MIKMRNKPSFPKRHDNSQMIKNFFKNKGILRKYGESLYEVANVICVPQMQNIRGFKTLEQQ